MNADTLRVGIIADALTVPHWAYYMINRIEQDDYAEISLLVRAEKSAVRANGTICKLLCSIDKRLHTVTSDAFEPKDLHPLLPTVPVIQADLLQQAEYDCLGDKDCKKIEEYELDVLISLSNRSLKGKVITSARYGVWAYRHGHYRSNIPGLSGSREVLAGFDVTGSALILLSNDQGCEKILFKSYSRTDPASFIRQNSNLHWKAASFVPRKLKEMQRLGPTAFWQKVDQINQQPASFSQGMLEMPDGTECLHFLAKRLLAEIKGCLRRFFFYEQYILLYRIDNDRVLANKFENFSMLIPPHDRFWADPFVVWHEDKYYIFIEEVLGCRGKGHIAWFSIDKAGNCTTPQPLIEQPYHMSYPFIFSYGNEFYMIPETAENKRIDVYRCTDFPGKWEYASTLMEDVDAYDTTLLYRDGKWWLFVCLREISGVASTDELFLYFADDPFAENWTPHRQNPVVSDVRSARPAGRIFEYNGNLYRPSQNSAKRYGYGMKINRIEVLSEEEYRESCVEDVLPLWHRNIRSVHTLNFAEHFTIIDAELQQNRFPAAILRRLRAIRERF